MSRSSFKGKTVVVTGGASGIGHAVCQAFARKGAGIAMLDMDPAALGRAETEFKTRGWPILTLTCNVTSKSDCDTAINAVIDHFGGIDVLFNNAGITQRGLFNDTRVQVFEQVMQVNFFGSLYCTKAALPAIIRRKGAIIVNESIAGVAPLLGRTGYSASKHALHGLFTSLRCELRSQGVHVMIVCPGFIRTNLQTRALGADGNIATHEQTRIGSEDTAEHAADQIVAGLERKTPNLVLTFMGKLGYALHRLSPVLYEKLMTRQFKKELSSSERL